MKSIHPVALLVLFATALSNRAAIPTIPNSGFESPVAGAGQFKYSPTGGSWTFGGGTGVSGNGSGFTSANSVAPQGVQVAFIQGTGRFYQTVSGFEDGVKYILRFSAAQRNYGQPGQTWNLELDGVKVAAFDPPQVDCSYIDYAVPFVTSAGSHELAFRGTLLHGGDCTVLIDNVRLVAETPTPNAPDGLGAVVSAADAVALTWNDNANTETGYSIEKAQDGGAFQEIRTTAANVTTQTISGLAKGATYQFRVRATNSFGFSNYSTPVLVTIPAGSAVDYGSRPFVDSKAPTLNFQRKLRPNPKGIDYAFAEQTARGVALLSRFPTFTNQDRRIHIMGPWYSNNAVNLHFSRGITTISALPNYRLNDSDPATVRKLAPAQKWDIEGDPTFRIYANKLADSIVPTNPSETAVVSALRSFANDHVFTDNQAAFTQLGSYMWNGERTPLDINGRHVYYFSADIEQTGGWDFQRKCFGSIYQGMAAAATARGQVFVPVLYGQYQFSINCFQDSTRQGGATTSNPPDYLLADRDFIPTSDPTLAICQTNNGVLSMDGYVQAVWGNDPLMLRDSSGKIVLAGGSVGYATTTNTAAYGARITLENGEAKHCLDDLYRQALRMYLQWYRRAGVYPANSALRKSFLTNTRIGAWTRITNEGLLGINQNDRPLPAWELELLCGMYLFTADDLIVWSSDFNYAPAALGGNYSTTWKYNAHGVLESVVKAAHRYNAVDPLHSGEFKWCWFNLPVINQNLTVGDRYFEKPIAMGKLRAFEGHTYLELFLAWPALDGEARDFKIWVDHSGARSRAYTATLQNGRSYFYDAWQLPDNFTNLEGTDIQIRTTDLLGVQRTWHGDWRTAANNTIATPEDFPRPIVRVSLPSDKVALDWDEPNFVLEAAADVTGPWAPLDLNSPAAVDLTSSAGFFRLRQ